MSAMEIGDTNRLGHLGFRLNYNIKGGQAVILPLHSVECLKEPCSCGANDTMPKDVVNCRIEWPELKKTR